MSSLSSRIKDVQSQLLPAVNPFTDDTADVDMNASVSKVVESRYDGGGVEGGETDGGNGWEEGGIGTVVLPSGEINSKNDVFNAGSSTSIFGMVDEDVTMISGVGGGKSIPDRGARNYNNNINTINSNNINASSIMSTSIPGELEREVVNRLISVREGTFSDLLRVCDEVGGAESRIADEGIEKLRRETIEVVEGIERWRSVVCQESDDDGGGRQYRNKRAPPTTSDKNNSRSISPGVSNDSPDVAVGSFPPLLPRRQQQGQQQQRQNDKSKVLLSKKSSLDSAEYDNNQRGRKRLRQSTNNRNIPFLYSGVNYLLRILLTPRLLPSSLYTSRGLPRDRNPFFYRVGVDGLDGVAGTLLDQQGEEDAGRKVMLLRMRRAAGVLKGEEGGRGGSNERGGREKDFSPVDGSLLSGYMVERSRASTAGGGPRRRRERSPYDPSPSPFRSQIESSKKSKGGKRPKTTSGVEGEKRKSGVGGEMKMKGGGFRVSRTQGGGGAEGRGKRKEKGKRTGKRTGKGNDTIESNDGSSVLTADNLRLHSLQDPTNKSEGVGDLSDWGFHRRNDSLNTTGMTDRQRHRMFLEENVGKMKEELESITSGLHERGILSGGGGMELRSRPYTAPVVNNNNNNNNNNSTTAITRNISTPSHAPPQSQKLGGSEKDGDMTLGIIDQVEIDDQVVMLKFVLGDREDEDSANGGEGIVGGVDATLTTTKNILMVSSSLNATLGQKPSSPSPLSPLRIEAWDHLRKRRIDRLVLTALDCDRICGLSPKEIWSLVKEDRSRALGKIRGRLGVRKVGEERVEWEEGRERIVEVESADEGEEEREGDDGSRRTEGSSPTNESSSPSSQKSSSSKKTSSSKNSSPSQSPSTKGDSNKNRKTRVVYDLIKRHKTLSRYALCLSVPLSDEICTLGPLVLNKILVNLRCCLEPTEKGKSEEGQGVRVWVNRSRSNTINDAVSIQFPWSILSALLSSQRSLLLRSQYKWSSQKSVGEFLMRRVGVESRWEEKGGLRVVLDRRVGVPARWERVEVRRGDGNNAVCKVEARQEGAGIVFTGTAIGVSNAAGSPGDGHATAEPEKTLETFSTKITLSEILSLEGCSRYPWSGSSSSSIIPLKFDDNNDDDSSGRRGGRNNPIEYALDRLSISPDEQNGLGFRFDKRIQTVASNMGEDGIVRIDASIFGVDSVSFSCASAKRSSSGDEFGDLGDLGDLGTGNSDGDCKAISRPLIMTVSEMVRVLRDVGGYEEKTLKILEDCKRRHVLAGEVSKCLYLIDAPSDSTKTDVDGQEGKDKGRTCKKMLVSPLYVETRVLKIVVNALDNPVGCVEVNNLTTLSQLRSLISAQLDPDDVPKSFKFEYRDVPCSRRQEDLRKAFDLLPLCVVRCKILPKNVRKMMEEREKEERKRVDKEEKAKAEDEKKEEENREQERKVEMAEEMGRRERVESVVEVKEVVVDPITRKRKTVIRRKAIILNENAQQDRGDTYSAENKTRGDDGSVGGNSRVSQRSKSPTKVLFSDDTSIASNANDSKGSEKAKRMPRSTLRGKGGEKRQGSRSRSPGGHSVDSGNNNNNISEAEGKNSPKKARSKTALQKAALKMSAGPIMVAVPIGNITVQCTPNSVHVKCNSDLTKKIEPNATIRIGNPFGGDFKLSGVLPPHLVKEKEEEEERVRKEKEEETKREEEERARKKAEETEAGLDASDSESEIDEDELPDKIVEEMRKQKEMIAALKSQLTEAVKRREVEKRASMAQLAEKQKELRMAISGVDPNESDKNSDVGMEDGKAEGDDVYRRPRTPPPPLPDDDIFDEFYLTLSTPFDAAKAKKTQPKYRKKKEQNNKQAVVNLFAKAAAGSPSKDNEKQLKDHSKQQKDSPTRRKATRSQKPLFKRPTERGGKVIRSVPPSPESILNVFKPLPQDPSASEDENSNASDDEFLTPNLSSPDKIMQNFRVWKLVPKSNDNRRMWRIEYDNNNIPYGNDFQNSTQCERHFGVSIPWRVLENWCVDKHADDMPELRRQPDYHIRIKQQQRVDYFPKISADKIIDEAFKFICRMHPPSMEVEGAKWAKFMRDIELFPKDQQRKANTHIDLAFARQLSKNKEGKSGGKGAARVIKIDGFKHALMEIASLRFPHYEDPATAMNECLLNHVVMVKEINAACWREAKRMAMTQEALIQCATIRCQADTRKLVVYKNFNLKKRSAIKMQAFTRRVIYTSQYKARTQMLVCDRVFRRRYAAASLIAKVYCEHVVYEIYMANMREMMAKEREKQRQIRLKQKAAAAHRKAFIIHRETTKINGVLCCLSWTKLDPRFCSIDAGVVMTIYVPSTCGKFRFEISEEEMRGYAERDRLMNGVSYTEVMDIRNLMKLKMRLKCRINRAGRPQFKYSRRAQSERGLQMLSSGFNIAHMAIDRKKNILVPLQGSLYICTAFKSSDAISFSVYDPKTSQCLRASAPLHLLTKWLKREELSKIRQVENARRQKVSDAHKLIGLYKIGVKYSVEQVQEAVKIIEDWLEMRQRESMSVVKGLKKKEGDASEKDSAKKKRQMTSREIKLNSINEGGGNDDDDDDDDEEEEEEEDEWGSIDESKNDAIVAVPPQTNHEAESVQSENPQDDGGGALAVIEPKLIDVPDFCNWSVEDILGASEETTYMDKEPLLLRQGHEYDLVQYLLNNLKVFVGTKRGFKVFYNRKHVLMFEHNVQDMVKVLSAEKLQGLWRMRKARQYIKKVIKHRFRKRMKRSTGKWYYIDPNSNNRLTFWSKPIGLGKDDLDDPEDVWIKDEDSNGDLLWINEWTGQESYLSQNENANIIQKCAKGHLGKALGSPTLGEMIRAIKFQNEAEEKYAEFPDKLSSVVNYALLQHTHHFEFELARTLYKDALKMSPENPVLLRAYALFALASCEPPRLQSWEKCQDMLRNAALRDQKGEKFQVCQDSFFHFGVIQNPTNRLALLNYALLQQCIKHDYPLADRLYRMAIRYAPNDKLVLRNYNDFLENQLPGGLYFREDVGPNGTVEKRSVVEEERPEWGEWVIMRDKEARDARFAKYWFNIFTSKTRWVEPGDWAAVWKVRVARSQEVRCLGNFKEWYDPKLDLTFYQDIDYEERRNPTKASPLDDPVVKEEDEEGGGEPEFIFENPFGDSDDDE